MASVPWGVKAIRDWRDDVAYQEQLRLARAEGLPTTGPEFVAYIRTAKPEENAAPLYARYATSVASKSGPRAPDFDALDNALTFDPNARNVHAARKECEAYAAQLELIDQAARLPRCWFDRDWTGVATLFPEYAKMKSAAKVVALRGSIAAHEGRPTDAIEDARSVFVIATHAGEEPHMIARLVQEAIYRIGLKHLAAWAFVHRDRPEYARALHAATDALPRPQLKDEHRGDLYDVLSMIELCATPQGRAELGLREEDVPQGAERLFSLLLSKSKARITIVKAARAKYAALDLPVGQRGAAMAAATDEMGQALLAFPTAAHLLGVLSSGGITSPEADREQSWIARHQMDVALARALQHRTIPKALDTRDLRSPFDGKPLAYTFDGQQIGLEVSGYGPAGGPSPLRFPRDEFVR